MKTTKFRGSFSKRKYDLRPSLVQIMARSLFGAKPFLNQCWLIVNSTPKKHISVKFQSKFKHFHSRNCFYKVSSTQTRPFCLGLNVLVYVSPFFGMLYAEIGCENGLSPKMHACRICYVYIHIYVLHIFTINASIHNYVYVIVLWLLCNFACWSACILCFSHLNVILHIYPCFIQSSGFIPIADCCT